MSLNAPAQDVASTPVTKDRRLDFEALWAELNEEQVLPLWVRKD